MLLQMTMVGLARVERRVLRMLKVEKGWGILAAALCVRFRSSLHIPRVDKFQGPRRCPGKEAARNLKPRSTVSHKGRNHQRSW